jgi:YD repeat-containing protein
MNIKKLVVSLAFLGLMANGALASERDPQQAKPPAQPAWQALLGLTISKTFDADGRPDNVWDTRGAHHGLEYDAAGRVSSVTHTAQNVKVVFTYPGEETRPSEAAVYDLETGQLLLRARLKAPGAMRAKSADPGPGYIGDTGMLEEVDIVGTLDDPWGGQYYLSSGLATVAAVTLADGTHTCSVSNCDGVCDAGLASATTLCGVMALVNPTVGALCAGMALGAWGACRRQCANYCSE